MVLANRLKCVFFMVALLAFTPFLAMAKSDREPSPSLVFSGVVLEQGHNPLIKQFTQWLAHKADYPLTTQFTDSYQGLSKILRETPLAVAWTCGAPFVEDHAADQQQLIAVPLFHGSPDYHSLVMTRAGRTEKKLVDFKGQVFAYSDPRSNSGFVAPAYALKQQGINIQQFFRYLMHTGLHEYSLESLLSGQADVATIDEYVVDEYFKANPDAKDKIVILESFGPFPFTPIVAGQGVSKEAIKRMQHALLTMHEDKEGAAMLKQFGLDGFVVKPVSFYQPIAEMLNAVHQ